MGRYDKPHDVSIGLKLVKAGYAIVTIFAGCLLAFQIYFWTIYSQLSATSKTVSMNPQHMRSGIFKLPGSTH